MHTVRAGSAGHGELVGRIFDYDGGRQVTVYVPASRVEAVVFAGDGEMISRWGPDLEASDAPSTMVIGVHGHPDETLRLHEYSPDFDPQRFAAHERFVIDEVRQWSTERFGVDVPRERTAIFGVSAAGELALAVGLRNPDIFGAILCASPGAGYRPPVTVPRSAPRTYLVAGHQEPLGERAARCRRRRPHDAANRLARRSVLA
jgi:pimeloyl-ACP methyl ester carboxylesterase